MLKYRCLVLDHDDTVVRSTPEIHFPIFQNTLAKLRPAVKMTLEDFVAYCFDPGFNALCLDILGFTGQEMEYQVSTWKEYVSRHIPAFYEGMKEIVYRQKQGGGLVCVVSHSHSDNILRDYRENCGILPDLVFGWELGEQKRKPHPYPLEEIMRTYRLLPRDLIVIDDLKPGYDMARSCGIDFACAGWSNTVPSIAEYMKANCGNYFSKVQQLEKFLFE